MNEQYTHTLNIVKESIHRIDPYGLLASGCPQDEFDSEIRAITLQIPRCESSKDIAHAIARVINSSFSLETKPEEFELESEWIFAMLIKHKTKS
jgi:hypothetical protein